MRRFVSTTAVILLSLLVAATATAQVRGRGRLQGLITDETGKPVAGATVTLALAGEETLPIAVKTDSKGRWSALGLTNGTWNIDVAAAGYETSRGTAAVSEFQMSPMLKTTLVRTVVQERSAEAIPVAPTIPQEAIEAIKEGEALLKTRAGDVTTSGDPAISHTVTEEEGKDYARRAVAKFEQALPLVPAGNPEVSEIRNQLMQVMAQAYYRAGNLPKAIAMLEQANAGDPTAADPGIAQRNLLLVNLYLENGDLARGRALLEKLPAGAVTDPTVYVNIGILFLNKKNPADAVTYLTKAVELDPKRGDSYYYRGLAGLQLKKNSDAKADFEQVIALSPDSPEAGDAKQYLASLKK